MTWLKVETDTPEKPEVWAMSSQLSIDPEVVFVKLFKVWRWFDQHTEEGNAAGVTKALVDSISGVTGFADAMVSVKWLIVTGAGISLPKFDRHNGESAKKRANTAVRVAKHKTNAKGNAEGNAESVTGELPNALPREEKRREEKKEGKSKTNTAPRFDAQAHLESMSVEPAVARDWLILRAGKKLKPTETAFAGVLGEAKKLGISMNDALLLCCKRGWGGLEAEWVTKNQATGPPQAENKQEALEARNRAVAERVAQRYANGNN